MNVTAVSYWYWLFVLLLCSCDTQQSQRSSLQLEGTSNVQEPILPVQGVPGWDLQIEAVLGRATNESMMFQLRIASEMWTMLFPANAILPGMQLRAGFGVLTIVDPATVRMARLVGRRFDPLQDPHFPCGSSLAGPIQRYLDGSWTLRFFGKLSNTTSALLELKLQPGEIGRFPTVREVVSFLSRRFCVELPPAVYDMPVMRWEWREKRNAREGFSRFTILQAQPTRLLQEDVTHNIAGYTLHTPFDVLPKLVQDLGSTFPVVTVMQRSGIVFVNQTPRSLLIPGQLFALGVPIAEIQLIPLLGGIPVWEGTIRGPHVWTLDN